MAQINREQAHINHFEGTLRKSFGRYFADYSPFSLPDNVPCHMLMGTCRRRILWLSLWMVMKKLLVLYTATMTHYGRGGRSSLRSNAARNCLALRVEISALGESRWLVVKSLNRVCYSKLPVKSRCRSRAVQSRLPGSTSMSTRLSSVTKPSPAPPRLTLKSAGNWDAGVGCSG
jgi:hypothetical protein